jgi:acyl dehydratase
VTTIVEGPGGFHGLEGAHLGYSDWHPIDQERVDRFADATGDHQWIHVDPARAASGPFGGTIAHGYLTLAMAPALLQELLQVHGMRFGVNYGCNKVRFPAPLRVGTRLRLGAQVAGVEGVEGGVQVTLDLTLEAEGAPKPVCVAQVVYRYYG